MHFNYESRGGSNSRLFLTSTLINNFKYDFTYNTSNNLPDPLKCSVDHWGFWNDISRQYTAIPQFTVNSNGEINFTSTERDAANNMCDIALLNKIVFPTGGQLFIEYEPHSYSKRIEQRASENWLPTAVSKSGTVGGARVKQLRETDRDGNFVKKQIMSTKQLLIAVIPEHFIYGHITIKIFIMYKRHPY